MQALQVRPSKSIRVALELGGLDVINSERPSSGSHVLLIPVGMRMGPFQVETESDFGPIGLRTFSESVMRWERIETRTKRSEETLQCLWDFIELVDGTVEEFLGFVSKWGLFDLGTDPWGGEYEDFISESEVLGYGKAQIDQVIDQRGITGFGEWRAAARVARSALRIIAATEAGELVSADVLKPLDGWDDYRRTKWGEKSRLERLRVEYGAGHGLELQRRVIVNLFNGSVEHRGSEGHDFGVQLRWMSRLPEPVASWDDKGRRIEPVAYGVQKIIGSHMLSIFSSPGMDVYVCSVCGKPYPFESSGRRRRPRKGWRHFCSEACKIRARRTDNLASWHKNKAKWLRKSEVMKGGKKHEEAS